MTQQIQSQGLGLRRDIIEAQTRLDYQMKEAMDSIRAGDANGAREVFLAVIDVLMQIDETMFGPPLVGLRRIGVR